MFKSEDCNVHSLLRKNWFLSSTTKKEDYGKWEWYAIEETDYVKFYFIFHVKDNYQHIFFPSNLDFSYIQEQYHYNQNILCEGNLTLRVLTQFC